MENLYQDQPGQRVCKPCAPNTETYEASTGTNKSDCRCGPLTLREHLRGSRTNVHDGWHGVGTAAWSGTVAMCVEAGTRELHYRHTSRRSFPCGDAHAEFPSWQRIPHSSCTFSLPQHACTAPQVLCDSASRAVLPQYSGWLLCGKCVQSECTGVLLAQVLARLLPGHRRWCRSCETIAQHCSPSHSAAHPKSPHTAWIGVCIAKLEMCDTSCCMWACYGPPPLNASSTQYSWVPVPVGTHE